jgi:threonyl-tRNA synthetase
VLGDKELAEGAVALRVRGAEGAQQKLSVEELMARIQGEVRERKIGLS